MGNPGPSKAQARLGRYELLARLATGGMGEIFLARLSGAEGFEKLYVVKRILPHLADDARFRQMLVSEARIASKMAHPNICQVYELGDSDGQLYIVMEYLEGVSLLPLLRRSSKQGTPLDFGFVAGVMQQTTDALNYAHELKDRGGESLGIVHRDVTPSNIFITESGVAKVLDFGIAKAKGASTQTQEGTVKGKYAYMAPEQLRGAAVDRRADIFALGIVLYEMLALRRLFQRKTDYLTFRAVMEQPIPDVRRYRPDVPEPVAQALMKALDRDPDTRWQTARQFGTALLDALRDHSRVWSQGELSDFVSANFAEELGKRSQQVASVIHRTSAGKPTADRATMPLLAHQDEDHEDPGGEDEEFPSVETEVDGAPPFRPTPPAMAASSHADFEPSTTPQPFGVETTGSAPSLKPLRPTGQMAGQVPTGAATGPIVLVNKRSLVWPLLAVAMIAIAAGALFLVWKQTQQAPSVVNITSEPAAGPRVTPPPERVPPPTPLPDHATGSADGSDTQPTRPHVAQPARQRTAARAKTYDGAIADKKPEMVQCLNDHKDGIPNEAIVAVINISAAGHARNVSLKPEGLNSQPLGACIRNVLMAAGFPASPADVQISVPLKAKSS